MSRAPQAPRPPALAVADLRRRLVAAAPPEPAGLRHDLFARALEDRDTAEAQLRGALAGVLLDAWRQLLPSGAFGPAPAPPEPSPSGAAPAPQVAAGLDPFASAVRAAGLEPWLWLVGERTWAGLVEALAGRLARRSRCTAAGAETLAGPPGTVTAAL